MDRLNPLPPLRGLAHHGLHAHSALLYGSSSRLHWRRKRRRQNTFCRRRQNVAVDFLSPASVAVDFDANVDEP